jgi:hypothetical protein
MLSNGKKLNLLSFWRSNLLILSFGARLDIFKVIADILGKVESRRVFSIQVPKEFTKNTAAIYLITRKVLGLTIEAIPLGREVLLIHRRVDTFEVKSARATITTNQLTITTTRGAVIVIIILVHESAVGFSDEGGEFHEHVGAFCVVCRVKAEYKDCRPGICIWKGYI